MLKLKLADFHSPSFGIDWQEQDIELVKLMKPVTEEGIKIGIAIGEQVLGRQKNLDDTNFNYRVDSLLQIRMDKLTGVNTTIKNRLEKSLRSALTEQIQSGASVGQQVSAMQEAVRSFFNMSSSRALLIARTESGGAVNGGSMLYYQNEGVESKSWVSAHDELVRETHRQCEEQGVIPMSQMFSNGLMFPQDMNGEVGEVVNCRCSLLPEIS